MSKVKVQTTPSTQKNKPQPVQRRGTRLSISRKRKQPDDTGRAAKVSNTHEESLSEEFSSEDSSEFEDFEDAMRDAGLLSKTRQEGTIPAVPATSHVSQKTRKKIIQGEFFDISRLLPTLQDEEEDMDKLEEKKKSKLTFSNWIRCYHTFMSIRLQYAPEELQGMLRHAENVQDLISQGRDGILYDAKFRRAKEQHPSIAWGEYIAQIVNGLPLLSALPARPPFRPRYLDYSAARPSSSQSINYSKQDGSLSANRRQYVKPCLKFNSTSGCLSNQCKFAHNCRYCGKVGHPVFRCWAKPSR